MVTGEGLGAEDFLHVHLRVQRVQSLNVNQSLKLQRKETDYVEGMIV